MNRLDKTSSDALYDLLPAIHRARDVELGHPLQALLRAISDQAAELSENIERQYENWFIETCGDDLVPYFADLVALSLGAPAGGDVTAPLASVDAAWRRRQVADALADRRRKGTFAVLEQLAFDATGWPARALELSASTVLTASARMPALGRRPLLDTGDGEELDSLGTPFAETARLADVRRLSSARTPGYPHPSSVAVSLWRLAADTTQRQPAASAGEDHHYTFDPLGRDVSLSVAPVARRAGTAPAGLLDVPTAISRLSLARRLEDYYGPGRSIRVYRGSRLVPRSEIIVGDLSGWRHPTPAGRVTIDPVRGRIAFPARHAPEDGVWVAYSRLTVGGIGGGHYARPSSDPDGGDYARRGAADGGDYARRGAAHGGDYAPPGAAQGAETARYRVAKRGAGFTPELRAALSEWSRDWQAGKAPRHAVIEICDDEVYFEHLRIGLGPGQRLEIRAASGCRPIVRPLEERTNRPDAWRIHGSDQPHSHPRAGESSPAGSGGRGHGAPQTAIAAEPGGGGHGAPPTSGGSPPAAPELVLDGIWIAGAPLELIGEFGAVTVRHCTLVPAAGVVELEAPPDRSDPSLVVNAIPCPVAIASSVVGRIRVECDEVGHDPIPVSAMDSILDASDHRGQALEGAERGRAFASLQLARTTVLGGARVRQVREITDSLFAGRLECERRQVGKVSFSYLSPSSTTPRRTSCQPDGVLAAVDELVRHGQVRPEDRERVRSSEAARVAPAFDSTRFGDPAYGRLVDDAANELTRGSHDEGELGAYHDQWQRLRGQDLQRRLDEFAPAGIEIDILYAT